MASPATTPHPAAGNAAAPLLPLQNHEHQRKMNDPGNAINALEAHVAVDPRSPAMEQAVLHLASVQHGVVSRRQLLALGMSARAILWRLTAGRLRRIHRSVYLLGPLELPGTREHAAALACGADAAISHVSAAVLWRMPLSAPSALVDVSMRRGDRRIPGVRVHRPRALLPTEITIRSGIPVTTPARTLLDLAANLPRPEFERVASEALVQGLTNAAELAALMKRHPRHPGLRRLRGLVDAGEPAFTRSSAERRFLDLVRRGQLPAPAVNVRLHGFEVDFYWRKASLVAEVDGRRYHSSPQRFESDRRRDAVLAAKGIRVMRVTWRQLETEPEALLVRLAQALSFTS
jgi:very-short-patch-repair endonuclease